MKRRESTKQLWDKIWQNSNLFYNEKIISVLKENFTIEKLKILEVGAGSGNTSLFLASLGADVTALDYSEASLNLIRKNNINNLPINIVKGDAFNIPFKDNTFDLVFSQGLIEHFTNPEGIVNEKQRVTKKGGFVLIDVPQKYNIYTIKKEILIFLNKWFAGWQRSFSIGELTKLTKQCGLIVQKKYAYAHIRNLYRIQQKLLKKQILPKFITKLYNQIWLNFEKSSLALYTLFSIIVLSKKNN